MIGTPKLIIDTRAERIIQTIQWINNRMGPAHFWAATWDICKYNQQRLVEYNRKQRALLPVTLQQYLDRC